MTMRPIRIIGDPVLRTACEPVTSFDAELRALVADLMDTLLGEPGRAGVAAPQIGVTAQVFVYDADGHRGHLINPTPGAVRRTPGRRRGLPVHPRAVLPDPPRPARHRPRLRPARRTADHLRQRIPRPRPATRDRPPAGRLYVDTLRGDTRRRALREIRAGRFDSPTRHR